MWPCPSVVKVLCAVFVERSLQRLALLLDHYGLDMKDLSPEQKEDLPAALKQLQLESSYAQKESKGRSFHFTNITNFTAFFKAADRQQQQILICLSLKDTFEICTSNKVKIQSDKQTCPPFVFKELKKKVSSTCFIFVYSSDQYGNNAATGKKVNTLLPTINIVMVYLCIKKKKNISVVAVQNTAKTQSCAFCLSVLHSLWLAHQS